MVVDATKIDKYRDLFVQALIKECERQGVEHSLVYVSNNVDAMQIDAHPTVFVEPYGFVRLKMVPDADEHTTAKVVAGLIRDLYNEKPNPNVLVINRSELIGKPLYNMLLQLDCAPIYAHSKTPTDKFYKLCEAADVIVTATGNKIELPYIPGQTIIDVSADATDMKGKYNISYWGMSEIGKATVTKIVSRGKGEHKKESY